MIEIYTDGHCEPNPGPGGWGVVMLQDGRVYEEIRGYDPATTNNRMEIKAIIEGIKSVPYGLSVTVFSDSQLAINVLSGKWQARANLDLVEPGIALVNNRSVEWRWVKGHSGEKWNDRADRLAGMWTSERHLLGAPYWKTVFKAGAQVEPVAGSAAGD